MIVREKETSVLSDGTEIPRVYKEDRLEAKRIDAINRMGTKWLMHPKNFVQRAGKKKVRKSAE